MKPAHTEDFYDASGQLWRVPPVLQMSRDQVNMNGAWVCARHGAITNAENHRGEFTACPICRDTTRLQWLPPLASRTTRARSIGRNVRWSRVYA